jgi:hypothetical protein
MVGVEANNPSVRDKANAVFLGIAIHCAQNSKLCNNTQAKDDLLPDEPGGYAGFKALVRKLHYTKWPLFSLARCTR